MKSSLLLVGLMLMASCAEAQHSHSPSMGGSGVALGNNQGNWGYGWRAGIGCSSTGCLLLAHEGTQAGLGAGAALLIG